MPATTTPSLPRRAVRVTALSTAIVLLAGSSATAQPAPPPDTLPVLQAPWGTADTPATAYPPPPDLAAEPLAPAYPMAPAPILRPRDNPAVRIVMESLAGIGMGVVIALGGSLLGGVLAYAADPSSHSEEVPLVAVGAISGGTLGYIFGVPLGVLLAGQARGRNGGYGWSLLGELAGYLGAGIITAAVVGPTSSSDAANAVASLSVFVLPLAGAIVGYELSSDPTPAVLPPRAGLHLAPVFSVAPGGGRLGLAGTF